MQSILILLLTLLFFFAGAVGTQALTLAECIQKALQSNPQLAIKETQVKIAKREIIRAQSDLLPTVDFSGNTRYQSTVPELEIPEIQLPVGNQVLSLFPGGNMTLGSKDSYDLSLTVKQPLFTGFRLLNKKDATMATFRSKKYEIEQQKIQLIYETEKAYGQVLLAQHYLDIAMASKRQVKSHLRDVENYVKQGMARKDELLRVQVKLKETELEIVRAENAVDGARVVLENLIGEEISSQSQYEGMKFEELSVSRLDAAIENAHKSRPELSMLKETRQATKAHEKVARGAFYPRLFAFGTFGYGKPGLDFVRDEWMDYWIVGVGAEWNLWDWGDKKAMVEKAQLNVKQINQQKQKILDAIKLDVTHGWLQLKEAKENFVLSKEIEERSQETFTVVKNSYKQGMASNSDYLDAQADLTRARSRKAQARINLELAKANLKRAMALNVSTYEEKKR